MFKFGVYNLTPILKMVLNQLGVSFCEILTEDNLQQYAVIINNNRMISDTLIDHVKSGGTVVDLNGSLLKALSIKR